MRSSSDIYDIVTLRHAKDRPRYEPCWKNNTSIWHLSYENTGLPSMCEMEFAQVDFTQKVRVYSESSEE